MSAIYERVGLPRHVNGTTAVNTLERWVIREQPPAKGGVTNFLRFENIGANPVVLSLNEEDAEATPQRGVTLAAAEVLEVPAEVTSFWTLSTLGTDFEAIAFIRRG